MTFNSLICNFFGSKESDVVTIKDILIRLIWIGLIITMIFAYFYGAYLHIFPIISQDDKSIIGFVQFICPGFANIVTIIGSVSILFYLWDKIKNKPVAHCPVKKEEDKNNEL